MKTLAECEDWLRGLERERLYYLCINLIFRMKRLGQVTEMDMRTTIENFVPPSTYSGKMFKKCWQRFLAFKG